MGNEISRLSTEVDLKDSIIMTDRSQIELYKQLYAIQTNEVIEAKTEAAKLRVNLKKERVKVIIWQVIAGLSLLSVLLY